MAFVVIRDLTAAQRHAKRLGMPLNVKPCYSDQKPKRCETVEMFERTVRGCLRRSPTGEVWIEQATR